MRVTLKDLRDVMHARPFRQFWLCLADGRKLHVAHPDFIAVSPTGRVVTIHAPDPVEGGIEIADLLLATRITFRKPGSGKRGGKRRTA
jgi:hypothetical protein